MIFTRNLRPLRPWRPFDVAQDMLCGRYSEIRLRLRLAVNFVVKRKTPVEGEMQRRTASYKPGLKMSRKREI